MYVIESHYQGMHAVAWKDEGLPGQVVLDSGSFAAARYLGDTFVEMFGESARIPLITTSQRRAFMEQHCPQAIAFEDEKLDESMLSAAL